MRHVDHLSVHRGDAEIGRGHDHAGMLDFCCGRAELGVRERHLVRMDADLAGVAEVAAEPGVGDERRVVVIS